MASKLLCLLLVGLCIPGMVSAECIDYGSYIHWLGGYNVTPGGNFELDVAVVGTTAYVAASNRLYVVDVSTSTSPVLLGSVSLGVSAPNQPALATGVTVVGSTAYVTDAYAGFFVVNVSNPAAPVVTGSVNTPGVAEDVAVAGTIAYVADHTSGLQVINVSNPASPTIIGSVDTPDRAMGVALSGTVAYVADQLSGLLVINIATPNSPAIIGSVDTPGNAEDLRAVGTTVYVSDAASGLQIIDASNPLSPVIVGSVDTPGYAWDLAISGTLAYVADGAPGIQVIDISNPASPTIVGTKDTPGDRARGIAVSGTLVFVMDSTYGLGVIDVSHLASPPVTGSLVIGSWSALKVVVSGSVAHVAAGYSGFAVIDVSNPATPMQIGSVAMPGTGQVFSREVAVVGTRAYVAYSRFVPPTGPSYAALAVVDVSNPASPQILGNVETSSALGYTTVAASNTNAYLCDGLNLFVIDASNPSLPAIVGNVGGFGSITGVAVSGSVAYVASSDFNTQGPGYLRTVDVSNPASPLILGTVIFPGIQAKQVTLSGQFAYVTVLDGQVGGASGLRVVQVTSPQTPTLVGSLPLAGRTQSVAVSGTYLYAGADNGGIHIVDVSNPASPAVIGNSDVYAMAVAADESWVYVTTTPGFSILPAQCATQTAVGPVDVAKDPSILGLAFPNPLDRSTTIPFTLTSGGAVTLRILDLSGREVRVLVNERRGVGEQRVGWDGRDARGQRVPAGVYIYELRTQESKTARRLVRLL